MAMLEYMIQEFSREHGVGVLFAERPCEGGACNFEQPCLSEPFPANVFLGRKLDQHRSNRRVKPGPYC